MNPENFMQIDQEHLYSSTDKFFWGRYWCFCITQTTVERHYSAFFLQVT